MKIIVKLYPEITIKSPSVRKRLCRLLESNLRNILRRIDDTVKVRQQWDRIDINSDTQDSAIEKQLLDKIAHTPGIAYFLEVDSFELVDMDTLFQQAKTLYVDQVAGKKFRVSVKRSGQHDFTSIEVERYVGGGLLQHAANSQVSLKQFDIEVCIEIKRNLVFMVKQRHEGMGGFPIAGQEDVLSLISGGFDSGVASYLSIRKGSRTHYCFFNLGGKAHEVGVKEVAYYLWDKFGSSHKVRFVAVPFEGVVQEILQKVDNSHMGVILKRMMLRAAAHIAEQYQIPALITGESIGQVSSQTLTNLNVIDSVTDQLVLRPLISYNKQEIIDVAKQIGTNPFAESMPEYCGVISNKPTVKAKKSKVLEEEAKFDMAVLEQAIEQAVYSNIQDLAEAAPSYVNVDIVTELPQDAQIIDIRHPDEQELSPLELAQPTPIHLIPFYKLSSAFKQLPSDQTYYLYCPKGVMSRLHGQHLLEEGHQNVKVFRPVFKCTGE